MNNYATLIAAVRWLAVLGLLETGFLFGLVVMAVIKRTPRQKPEPRFKRLDSLRRV